MKISKKIISVMLLTTSILSAQTLVSVNGTDITQSDVDSALMNATQGRFNQVPPEKQAEFRRQVLEQLVAKELIYSDAKKTGVLSSRDFKAEYKKVQEKVKKEIAVQIWQKKQMDKVKVSEKESKKYYKDNKGEFKEQDSVHARHILVKTKEEADSLLKDLKLKGKALKEKFIALAKEKSVGPSGPKGGDLGSFAKGQMVPAFNDKVFSMKVGTISQPVKTQFGYHIIYLEDKKAAKNLSFVEVKSFIEQRLKLEKFKTTIADTMKKLQAKATIK
ncbi:MAG: peptidyl-prolyl cis-trans isomerase C [Sulfurimonas sp.]|jgi:peptidyl-prolyl cis-trans isomerase C|uniref:peptidylprolyl isomerase n=1 Tax=Sulfurimonas sp. TaxID=2022749 RepID=UPI0039E46999